MSWFAFHLASGTSLFSGAALLIVGVLLVSKTKGPINFVCRICALLGFALILLSSTPFPFWSYLVFVGLGSAWVVVESVSRLKRTSFALVLRILLGAWVSSLILVEIPHRALHDVPNELRTQLCVIGDSISAGIDESPNWVEVFHQRFGARTVNLAKPAATLQSALKQADLLKSNDCVVLLEIGGNDLLGTTSSAEFGNDLRSLLKSVVGPRRTIVMLELPLLPGQAGLGRSQRALAREYNVLLIPKNRFCHVLALPNATLDGLHLSPSGTSSMAAMVYESIGVLLLREK